MPMPTVTFEIYNTRKKEKFPIQESSLENDKKLHYIYHHVSCIMHIKYKIIEKSVLQPFNWVTDQTEWLHLPFKERWILLCMCEIQEMVIGSANANITVALRLKYKFQLKKILYKLIQN